MIKVKNMKAIVKPDFICNSIIMIHLNNREYERTSYLPYLSYLNLHIIPYELISFSFDVNAMIYIAKCLNHHLKQYQ